MGQPLVAVHAGQQLKGGDIQPCGLLQGGVPVPPLGQQGIGALRPAQRLPQPAAQAGVARLTQLVEQVGIGLQAAQTVPVDGASDQAQGAVHHGQGEDIFIGGHALERGQHGFDVHSWNHLKGKSLE